MSGEMGLMKIPGGRQESGYLDPFYRGGLRPTERLDFSRKSNDEKIYNNNNNDDDDDKSPMKDLSLGLLLLQSSEVRLCLPWILLGSGTSTRLKPLSGAGPMRTTSKICCEEWTIWTWPVWLSG